MILPSRHKIRGIDLGALLSGGINKIEVYRKIKVGIIPTGSEIINRITSYNVCYTKLLRGYELASGSIRVHDPEIQKRIFSIVGIKEDEVMEKFGFLLESFKFSYNFV